MFRRAFSSFLFILFFYLAFSGSSFSNSGNHDSAAVIWVLYDGTEGMDGKDRSFFKKAPEFNKKVFCSIQSVFKVPEENCYTVPVKSPFSFFEAHIKKALNDLRSSKEPVLFISIDSEGHEAVIVQGDGTIISHENLLNSIFNQIDIFEKETAKKLTLKLFINTCHSHSILPFLKKRIAHGYGVYKSYPDEEWYRYKVDIFTSADENKNSYGNEFLEVLLEIAKKNNNSFEKKDWPLFCSRDIRNSHHVWSSYSSYSEVALNWILEAMGSYFVYNDPQCEYEVLSELDSFLTVGSVLNVVKILENHSQLAVRLGAANLLMKNGKTVKYVVPQLERLILKQTEHFGVRIACVKILGQLGPEEPGVVEALKKALFAEGEKSVFIREYAKKELDKYSTEEGLGLSIGMQQEL